MASSSTPPTDPTVPPTASVSAPDAAPAQPTASPSTRFKKKAKSDATSDDTGTAPDTDTDADAEDAEPELTAEQEFELHHGGAAAAQKPHLTVEHYVARHHEPLHQMAGFARHALDHHKGVHTVAQWDAFYESYKTKPA